MKKKCLKIYLGIQFLLVCFVQSVQSATPVCVSGLEPAAAYDLRVKHLKRLLDQNINANKKIMGFHETSLETIELALKTGFLPNGFATLPGIFVYPTRNPLNLDPKVHKGQQEFSDKIYQGKKSDRYVYSNSLSVVYGLAKQLGFRDLTLEVADLLLAMEAKDEEAGDHLDNLKRLSHLSGKTSRQITDTIEHLKQERRGVLITLSEDVYKDPSLTVTDAHPDAGYAIYGPNGIPFTLISGIRALGGYESNKLETLARIPRLKRPKSKSE